MRSAIFIFAVAIALLSSCNNRKRTPGICISFDDRSVKEWYTLRAMLRDHQAKVTFFVTQFDSLTPAEISMLKGFRDDGHEIASHGALHIVAENFIKKYSYKKYLAEEIDANTSAMKKQGFTPTSFAYPYGSKYWFTDYLLQRRFKVTRGVTGPKKDQSISEVKNTYYSFDGNRNISAIEFDWQNKLSESMIVDAINRAVENDNVLLLFAHQPSDSARDYTFDPKFLNFILDEAQRRHLTFFRTSDLSAN
jgi:peptidoglycan/xylan/chitin deacetylase (PgdA/CDA1 family)